MEGGEDHSLWDERPSAQEEEAMVDDDCAWRLLLRGVVDIFGQPPALVASGEFDAMLDEVFAH